MTPTSTPSSAVDGQGPINATTFNDDCTRIAKSLTSLRRITADQNSSPTMEDLSYCTVASMLLLNSLLVDEQDGDKWIKNCDKLALRQRIAEELTVQAKRFLQYREKGREATKTIRERYDPSRSPWDRLSSTLPKSIQEKDQILHLREQAAISHSAIVLADFARSIIVRLQIAASNLSDQINEQKSLRTLKSTKPAAQKLAVAESKLEQLRKQITQFERRQNRPILSQSRLADASKIHHALFEDLSENVHNALQSLELRRLMENQDSNLELDWGLKGSWGERSQAISEYMDQSRVRFLTRPLEMLPELKQAGLVLSRFIPKWEYEVSTFSPQGSIDPAIIDESWVRAKQLINDHRNLRTFLTNVTRHTFQRLIPPDQLSKMVVEGKMYKDAKTPEQLMEFAEIVASQKPMTPARHLWDSCFALSARLDYGAKDLEQASLQGSIKHVAQYLKSSHDDLFRRAIQTAQNNAEALSSAIRTGLSSTEALPLTLMTKARRDKARKLVRDMNNSSIYNGETSLAGIISKHEAHQESLNQLKLNAKMTSISVDENAAWTELDDLSDDDFQLYRRQVRKALHRIAPKPSVSASSEAVAESILNEASDIGQPGVANSEDTKASNLSTCDSQANIATKYSWADGDEKEEEVWRKGFIATLKAMGMTVASDAIPATTKN